MSTQPLRPDYSFGDELKKALSERILNAEIDAHLDGEEAEGKGNHRNGYSKKSVLTGTSKMTLSVPRDWAGTFDPKLIAKYQRRFPDFDEKIISMYARGMTVREIRGHLEELYGTHGWFVFRPRQLSWWIVTINMLGSILFMVSLDRRFCLSQWPEDRAVSGQRGNLRRRRLLLSWCLPVDPGTVRDHRLAATYRSQKDCWDAFTAIRQGPVSTPFR